MRSVFRCGRLLSLLACLLMAACQGPAGAAPNPKPTLQTQAGPIKCPKGDHGLDEVELGWGFCYPGSWRYRERLQNSAEPRGVDATFDIVNDLGSPPPGTAQSPDQGLFGFMIIGTYEKGQSASLRDWAAANLGGGLDLTRISWGNAGEAYLVNPIHKRIAMTAHHVILLDIREGAGNLALDSAMSQRLATWRFDY